MTPGNPSSLTEAQIRNKAVMDLVMHFLKYCLKLSEREQKQHYH